jgi:regulator of sigma E protease
VLSFLSLLLTLGLLIGVHEYGHYKMAVGLGVGVERFSFGFGPVLFRTSFVAARPWSRSKRHHPQVSTEFVLSLLPLGGYVKFLDASEESLPEQWSVLGFDQQKLWAKALIVLAGPLANLLLAWVLLTGMFMLGVNEPLPVINEPVKLSMAERVGFWGGDQIDLIASNSGRSFKVHTLGEFERIFAQECLSSEGGCTVEVLRDAVTPRIALNRLGQEEIKHSKPVRLQLRWPAHDWGSGPKGLIEAGLSGPWSAPVIEQVQSDGPAAQAGLHQGDWILSVNGQEVRDAKTLKSIISSSAQAQPPTDLHLSVGVNSSSESFEIRELEVSPKRVFEDGHWIGRIGVFLGARPAQALIHQGFYSSIQSAWETSLLWGYKIGEAIWKLFTFQSSLKTLVGPITMAQSAGESAHVGLAAFLAYLAMVSLNLGIFNLLPIPVLDGGHLAAYACQAALGRALSKDVVSMLQRLGLVLILVLSVLAIFNDLLRVWTG